MKLLIEVRKEDTIGNSFVNCSDCAVARAVKRVIKKGVFVSEGVNSIWIDSVRVFHEQFSCKNFRDLKKSPNGTVHILEMDIPEQFLKSTRLNQTNKLQEVKCAIYQTTI